MRLHAPGCNSLIIKLGNDRLYSACDISTETCMQTTKASTFQLSRLHCETLLDYFEG